MARNSAANLLTSVDELFTTQIERDEARRECVQSIPLSEISDFPDHPFKVRMDESMAEMAESVKQYGVLVPDLVRPKGDGFEMVAGHRRRMACELAGLTEISCIVRHSGVCDGQSGYGVEKLDSIVEASAATEMAKAALDTVQAALAEQLETSRALQKEYDRILTWADLYDQCTFEARKMIAAQLIRSVRVWRGYKMEIDFNISFEEMQKWSSENCELCIPQAIGSHLEQITPEN